MVISVIWHMLHLTVYYYSGYAVLMVLIMEEEEEMVKDSLTVLRLEHSAYVTCASPYS